MTNRKFFSIIALIKPDTEYRCGTRTALNFEYEQKSSFFALNSVGFRGKGVLATIP